MLCHLLKFYLRLYFRLHFVFVFQFDEVADKEDLMGVEDTAKRDILLNSFNVISSCAIFGKRGNNKVGLDKA